MIEGKQSYLYFEHSPKQTGNAIGRWFEERRARRSAGKLASGCERRSEAMQVQMVNAGEVRPNNIALVKTINTKSFMPPTRGMLIFNTRSDTWRKVNSLPTVENHS